LEPDFERSEECIDFMMMCGLKKEWISSYNLSAVQQVSGVTMVTKQIFY